MIEADPRKISRIGAIASDIPIESEGRFALGLRAT